MRRLYHYLFSHRLGPGGKPSMQRWLQRHAPQLWVFAERHWTRWLSRSHRVVLTAAKNAEVDRALAQCRRWVARFRAAGIGDDVERRLKETVR